MKKYAYLALLVAVTALSGCNDGEPARDVQYYLDHPDERAAKVAECRNDPGHKTLEGNCVNAAEAARQAMFSPENQNMPKIR